VRLPRRVGNRAFAEEYNRTVPTSWRVCNHRDIIPTVQRPSLCGSRLLADTAATQWVASARSDGRPLP
jgi:hypothetical protein